MEVILRGEKHISGVIAPFELILVKHTTFGVIEILGSEKNQGIEANRLYLDDSIVCKEIGTDDSQVAAFLFNKICISNYNPETKRLEISLSAHESLICSRPLGLKPYAHISDIPHKGISQHDLRRIPALFARVNQGEALGGADAELWANFTRNKSETDVIKFVATMLAEKLTENAEVVEGAVQAAVMPRNTPFPSHSEVPPLMSSRSFSDFAKMSLDDNNEDSLFAMPPLIRTQSYSSSSSPRSVPASPSHRKGELMVPSPSHRMLRAPLPRSGTSSALSSPTARKSTSGIAEAVDIVEEEKSQSKQDGQAGHKRVRSLGVLDSLKDALSRSIGMQSSPIPGNRVDTASSSDSNLSQSRGIAVDAEGVSNHSIASSMSGSASSKKASGEVRTPPVSPRPPLDAADVFPPHSAMHSRSNSFSSTNGGTSSRRHSFVTGQMVPCTPPPSAKKNAYSGLDCGSADSAANNNFSPRVDEGVRSRTPSRASSPSLLRAFTNWGGSSSSSSSKVVPGGWEDENSF